MVNGKAVMKGFGDAGLYINPTTGESQLQLSVPVSFVGEDGSATQTSVTAYAGLIDSILTIQVKIRAAIVAAATAAGYTLGIGDVLMLVVNKI